MDNPLRHRQNSDNFYPLQPIGAPDMARITWFVSACISICLGIVGNFAHALREVGDSLDQGWPAYHPSPGESIALDAATRSEVDARQPGIAASFAAFARRALTHDEFTAGHYDPGWQPS